MITLRPVHSKPGGKPVNNMVLTLLPLELLASHSPDEVGSKMDTNRDRMKGHMTGGRIQVAVRPSFSRSDVNHNRRPSSDVNHNRHVSVSTTDSPKQVSTWQEKNDHRNKVHISDKFTSRTGVRPIIVLDHVDSQSSTGDACSRGNVMMSQETLIKMLAGSTPQTMAFVDPQTVLPNAVSQIPLVQDQLCKSCQTIRRHSSSSSDELGEHSRSPRTSLHQMLEPPARTEDLAPLSPTVPSGQVQKYENIPVPGIIPKSRATSSPTPGKEVISVYSRLSSISGSHDRELIMKAEERLKCSGFYYDTISAQEAKKMLHPAEVGTFLVRISSQISHFFALSVKTNRGTTSIRISYDNGSFRLDADPESIAKMPAFQCVLGLIEYYVVQSSSDARNKCVFLESSGRRDTPVILTRPYRGEPQSLRHLCRRNLHYHLSESQLEQYLKSTSASVQLTQYIKRYPYAL